MAIDMRAAEKEPGFYPAFHREKMPLHSIYFVIWIIQR
jgi:hypothetical protein